MPVPLSDEVRDHLVRVALQKKVWAKVAALRGSPCPELDARIAEEYPELAHIYGARS